MLKFFLSLILLSLFLAGCNKNLSEEEKKALWDNAQTQGEIIRRSGTPYNLASNPEIVGAQDLKIINNIDGEGAEIVNHSKIQVHYFGYYEPWHPQGNYYYSVEHGGFVTAPERLSGVYTKYASIDDKMEEFNYYTTGIKYGIGWTSFVSAFESRSGDLTREEAVALTKKYDIEFPETWINDFLEYVSLPSKEFPEASKHFEQPIIDRIYFDNLVDKFRSPHIWKLDGDKWSLRKSCWDDVVESDNEIDTASNWTGNK